MLEGMPGYVTLSFKWEMRNLVMPSGKQFCSIYQYFKWTCLLTEQSTFRNYTLKNPCPYAQKEGVKCHVSLLLMDESEKPETTSVPIISWGAISIHDDIPIFWNTIKPIRKELNPK